eukprot:CAMPEP_0198679000 /NCGR_PEP_ID=MMETSP1468-20131203/1913_1 /TAXON_ID=1461545 /ORGANISM="Mantoniella sp, Strain CCMP1436" /LENGTH=98 /DNA_ID=CAMNT_0044417117 /DNA_START=151 /DNA_END=447 /DNA_ORIENTATION=+
MHAAPLSVLHRHRRPPVVRLVSLSSYSTDSCGTVCSSQKLFRILKHKGDHSSASGCREGLGPQGLREIAGGLLAAAAAAAVAAAAAAAVARWHLPGTD